MHLKKIISFFLCIYLCIGHSQNQDTLKTVEVLAKKDSILRLTIINSNVPHYIIDQNKLDQIIAEDIGDAIKYIPGTYIKDYGGLGGLKTISYRSLGAAHTSVAIDGLILPNTQTGTVNLNNFDIFGTRSIEMTSGQVQNNFASASAYLKANVLSLNSILFSESESIFEMKAMTYNTTINAFQNGVLLKHKLNDHLSYGVQGLYTFGSGAYSFSIKNVDSTFNSKRRNADVENIKIRGVINYRRKDLRLSLTGSVKQNHQNLPGVIVLYNPFNQQDISDQSTNGTLNLQVSKPNYALGINAYVQDQSTTYTDHLFQNESGILVNNYNNRSGGGGIIYSHFLGSKFQKIFLGADYKIANLKGSQFINSPLRQNIISVIGLSKWFWKIKFQANVTHQFIADRTPVEDLKFSHFSPFISFAILPIKGSNFRIRAHVKNTYRLPSFNDLYYNFIGNSGLMPENANTGNIGMTFGKKWTNQLQLETTLDIYNSVVDNKIVAIPTKNLFNWSMQNIGKTKSYGIELNLLISKVFKQFKANFSIGQSLNSSVDITDPNSITYGHQIPYTPVYTSSYSLGIDYKKNQLNLMAFYSGGRYTLNENIPFNYLTGFFDMGIGLSRSFSIKKKHLLKANVQMANVFNNNYEVIKSFPMPGRHFKFKLEYNFTK